MRRAAILVAVFLGAGGVAQAETAQQRFAAATALEARGQFAAAAAALEQLGHELPADPFAPDALYEAAVVAEERLSDPARARALYEEVATKYPSSRLSRRARTRADFLARSLSTGEAPLREYDDILAGAVSRPRAESLARMQALLVRWPDFALADRALFWLGQRLAEERRWDEARARFAEIERRFPSSEWARRGMKARADISLSRGHPFVARALYHELAASSDPVARSAGNEGLADSVAWMVRTISGGRLGVLSFGLRAAAAARHPAVGRPAPPAGRAALLPARGRAVRRRGGDGEPRHRRRPRPRSPSVAAASCGSPRSPWRRGSNAARCRSPPAPAAPPPSASPSWRCSSSPFRRPG